MGDEMVKRLSELLKTSEYKNANDEAKQKKFKDKISKSREEAKKDMLDYLETK